MTTQARQAETANGCCNDPGCTRKDPVHLYKAELTDHVYVVTAAQKMRSKQDGTAVFKAIHRHEITAQMENFIRRNQTWVRRILAERRDETKAS